MNSINMKGIHIPKSKSTLKFVIEGKEYETFDQYKQGRIKTVCWNTF